MALKGDAVMSTEQRRQLNGTGLGSFMGVAFLLFLSLATLADEVKSKKIEQPGEKINLQEVFRASGIIDETIRNGDGKDLGEVDDLIMSRNGKIKKVILSVGGFLGIDEKLVAVPFKPLKITDMGIVYNVTEQELENLPAFSDEGE
jgi:sporulation protein YlmC with PRC-barrel domain